MSFCGHAKAERFGELLCSSFEKRMEFSCSKLDSRWIFSKQVLEETPSRKNGISRDKELSYRQQAANLIQDVGQRVSV